MKKFILSTFVILGFVAYSLNQKNTVIIVPENKNNQTTTVIINNPGVTPIQSPKQMPMNGMMNTRKYKNGTYTGSNEYAYSDYIQVSAVITGGKLTDVQFPSSTGGPNRSQQIYSYAMPQLKSEAISAQSANVNTISGATYTSAAFEQSLATALSQALN